MKTKRIKIPIYYGTLVLVQSDNWAKVSERYFHDIDPFYEAVVFSKRVNHFTEYFVVFKDNPAHETIAHEAVHVVNRIFKDRGIKLDVDNDEPQAYLTSWVVSEIYKFIGN